MPTVPLPENPDLDQLRKQAKELHRAEGVPLAAAQLAIARRHGFPSWAKLKRHLDVVREHLWVPEAPAAGSDPAAVFLALACLTYTRADGPARRQGAAGLLAAHPELPGASIHVAAATANSALVRHFLAARPGSSRVKGGPYDWPPLAYLAYSRFPSGETVETARLLLADGADPNTGFLWHGLPSPFTLLTGVFGGGEMGMRNQPPHPDSLALARLLLDAGADPNDAQALYNRMFEPADDHLELLFEYGLGTGDGGVWRARLGDRLGSPAELVRDQLNWALRHDLLARVRLLVGHGVDVTAPLRDGRAPAEVAAVHSGPEMLAYLRGQGAVAPLDPVAGFVSAALNGALTSPALAARARQRFPALVLRAVALGRADAVVLLAELGFDVNAKGRQDASGPQEWETPLHVAVAEGNLEMARLLLSLGADPNLPDARFAATPLGWARHFDRPDLIELLEPVTASETP